MPFKGISYLELLQPFYSAECNHLCNFGRGYPEEQFCEIILNLGQGYSRKKYLEGEEGTFIFTRPLMEFNFHRH